MVETRSQKKLRLQEELKSMKLDNFSISMKRAIFHSMSLSIKWNLYKASRSTANEIKSSLRKHVEERVIQRKKILLTVKGFVMSTWPDHLQQMFIDIMTRKIAEFEEEFKDINI